MYVPASSYSASEKERPTLIERRAFLHLCQCKHMRARPTAAQLRQVASTASLPGPNRCRSEPDGRSRVVVVVVVVVQNFAPQLVQLPPVCFARNPRAWPRLARDGWGRLEMLGTSGNRHLSGTAFRHMVEIH